METFKAEHPYDDSTTQPSLDPQGAERRLQSRHRLMTRMTVATHENAFSGLATNLSSGGLCVVSRHRVNPKTSVQLRFA